MIKFLKRGLLPFILASTMLLVTACTEDKATEDSNSKVTTTEPNSSDSTTSGDSSDDTNKVSSDITPAMWEVKTKSGKTIYLLGSMHVLPDSAYPLPDQLINAYEKSDAIVVECDILAYQSDLAKQLKLAEDMVYKDGTKFKDHIDPEIYSEVVALMKEWGIYSKAHESFKPAMLTSLIENYIYTKANLKSELGIDMFFLDKATEESKEIIEVESAEFQMDMLMNFSDEINSLMLSSYAYDIDELVVQINELYEVWASGDTEKLLEANSADEDQLTDAEKAAFKEYNDTMLTNRNKGMADKVIELIENDDKDIFYIVGAAHYPGEGGIIELLEAQGVVCTPVQYK
ncbi:MAG: TraB/GumN family protein [Clostridiales bacterium]|nr:TraB/GumN family protein [Clostridiales bacterium]